MFLKMVLTYSTSVNALGSTVSQFFQKMGWACVHPPETTLWPKHPFTAITAAILAQSSL